MLPWFLHNCSNKKKNRNRLASISACLDGYKLSTALAIKSSIAIRGENVNSSVGVLGENIIHQKRCDAHMCTICCGDVISKDYVSLEVTQTVIAENWASKCD